MALLILPSSQALFPIKAFSPLRSLRTSRIGLTLVEVMVTAGLLTLMILGLMGLNSTCRAFVRSQRETALASYTIEHGIETMRARNWSQVSTASGVRTLLQGLTCDGLTQLDRPRIKVTVSPYPPLVPAPVPIVVERAANGTCTIISEPPAGFSLRSLIAVRVDLQLKWNTMGSGRERVREISSVVSLSGLIK